MQSLSNKNFTNFPAALSISGVFASRYSKVFVRVKIPSVTKSTPSIYEHAGSFPILIVVSIVIGLFSSLEIRFAVVPPAIAFLPLNLSNIFAYSASFS